MRIEPTDDGRFVIVRGKRKRQYFSFYVDTRTSWTIYLSLALKFPTTERARETLENIRNI